MNRRAKFVSLASALLIAIAYQSTGASAATALQMRTSTPKIEASGGVAKFTVGRQAAAPTVTYLQWLNPATNAWVNLTKFSRGAASASSLAGGVHQFRAIATRKGKVLGQSRVVKVSVMTMYGIRDTPYGFIDRPIRAVQLSYILTGSGTNQLALKSVHGCDSVNVGMGWLRSDAAWGQPTPSADFVTTLTIYSEVTPPFVTKITRDVLKVQALQVPVKGDVSAVWTWAGTLGYEGLMLGFEAHCVTNPFV